jgi:Flp pilus assembly pilin Flp
MTTWFKKLRHDEEGAVTVDWVVLAAALVGLGISIVSTTGEHQTAMGDKMSNQMSELADQYY